MSVRSRWRSRPWERQRSPRERSWTLEKTSATELEAKLAAGELTSVALTHAYLDRIAAVNLRGPSLNAVRSLNPNALDEARASDAARRTSGPRGPLEGLPVLLKDNVDVAGMPTTAASIVLEHSVPSRDAFLVRRLKAAGAVILGKLNLTEFAAYVSNNQQSGNSSLGGQVLNPYDTSSDPGGSSAGSGVAAASGLAALTVGSDSEGSIISPATQNGVVGIRPSTGLWSRSGVVPISETQDTLGPLTQTVSDAALLLQAGAGHDPDDPRTSDSPVHPDFLSGLKTDALQGARIGVSGTNANYVAARNALTALGATVVPINVTFVGRRYSEAKLLGYAYAYEQGTKLRRAPSEVNPASWRCVPGPRFDPHSCGPFSGFAGPLSDALVAPALDLEHLDIAEIQRRFGNGTLTSAGLVKAYLDRIRFVNQQGPGIDAVRAVNPAAAGLAAAADAARARGEASGPLAGIPVLVDDTIDVAGLPTTGGSMALEDVVPSADAALVTRLKAAGAIVLGKVNVTELNGMVSTGMPAGYGALSGQVLNPYDMRSSVNGASAGAVAAAAAGLAAATVGVETDATTSGTGNPSNCRWATTRRCGARSGCRSRARPATTPSCSASPTRTSARRSCGARRRRSTRRRGTASRRSSTSRARAGRARRPRRSRCRTSRSCRSAARCPRRCRSRSARRRRSAPSRRAWRRSTRRRRRRTWSRRRPTRC